MQIQAMMPLTPVVKAIVITCAVVWLLGQLIIDRFMLGGTFFTTYFALIPNFVVQKFFIWQLLTYAFLHSSSPFHIILNLLALWWLGSELEQRWGGRFFLTYYLVCTVGSAFLYVSIVLAYALAGGSVTAMLTPVMGASGAVFGLLLAYGIIFGERVVHFMMIFPMKAKYFVMILGGIEVVNLLNTGVAGSEVASLAHLGGIVSGYLFLLIHTRLKQKKWPQKATAQKTGKLKLVINNEKKKDGNPKYWN
jgi:membrane associated rhomboid family serine protease